MIARVRFKSPVSIGSVDCTEWHSDRPASTQLAGAVTARPGNADRGESRDSIVFECRIAKDAYDVEVPKSNIAHVIRTVDVTQDGKAKK